MDPSDASFGLQSTSGVFTREGDVSSKRPRTASDSRRSRRRTRGRCSASTATCSPLRSCSCCLGKDAHKKSSGRGTACWDMLGMDRPSGIVGETQHVGDEQTNHKTRDEIVEVGTGERSACRLVKKRPIGASFVVWVFVNVHPVLVLPGRKFSCFSLRKCALVLESIGDNCAGSQQQRPINQLPLLFTPLMAHRFITRLHVPCLFSRPYDVSFHVFFRINRVFKRHNAALAQGKPGYQTGMAFSFSPGVGAEGILLRQI